MRTPRMPATSTRTGFTLFELILVLAVIVVISSILAAPMWNWYARRDLEAGAAKVQKLLLELHTKAVREGRPYNLEAEYETGVITVSVVGNGWTDAPEEPVEPQTETLAEGILLKNAESDDVLAFDDDGDIWTVTFQPVPGESLRKRSVIVQDTNGDQLRLEYRPLTGEVLVSGVDEEAEKTP